MSEGVRPGTQPRRKRSCPEGVDRVGDENADAEYDQANDCSLK
jgi:hypothetical protein